MATTKGNDKKKAAPFARVLVIGAGFLGTHILREIQATYSDLQLSALDNRTSANQLDGVDYLIGDITQLEQVEEIISKVKPDVIIHTASPPPASHTDPALMFKVNVEGTRTILTVAERSAVRAFVYTSSAGVVYNGNPLVNVDENAPTLTHHVDPYNASKVCSI